MFLILRTFQNTGGKIRNHSLLCDNFIFIFFGKINQITFLFENVWAYEHPKWSDLGPETYIRREDINNKIKLDYVTAKSAGFHC